ncbi:MAG: hypothetical protein ACYDA3_00330 [Gaiellaceae bacterium]
MLRRIATVPLLVLAFAVPAHAAGLPPIPATLTETVTSAHFVAHYTSDPSSPDAAATSAVQTMVANAERAYTIETGWGWPGFKDDGDGHLDIYVYALAGASSVAFEVPLQGGASSTAMIVIRPTELGNPITIAHELFHALQSNIYDYAGSLLFESGAEWAMFGVAGNPGTYVTSYLFRPDVPLDCSGATCPADYPDLGYQRWIFWSYLESLDGKGIVKDVFDYGRKVNDGPTHGYPTTTEMLDGALAAHGSSLARAYADFEVANLIRSYPAAATASAKVRPSTLAASTPSSFALAHLTTSFVTLQAPTMPSCAAQQLHVRVTAAPAVASVTLVVGKAIAAAGTALDVTWNPCIAATLVVSNTSLSDGQPFQVVWTTGDAPVGTPTTSTSPGTKTVAGDVAPALALLGAGGTLKLKSSKPVLALSLSANAPGRVVLSLDGGTTLATVDVNPGTNIVRVALPKGLSGRKTLLVTSVSPGGAQGATLRLAVAFVR